MKKILQTIGAGLTSLALALPFSGCIEIQEPTESTYKEMTGQTPVPFLSCVGLMKDTDNDGDVDVLYDTSGGSPMAILVAPDMAEKLKKDGRYGVDYYGKGNTKRMTPKIQELLTGINNNQKDFSLKYHKIVFEDYQKSKQ